MSGPSNALIKRQLQEVLAPLEPMLARVLRSVLLGILLLASVLACLVFLSIAADTWLSTVAGPIVAALALAGLYLLIAIACVLALRTRTSNRTSFQKAAAKDDERVNVVDAQSPAPDANEEQSDPRSDNIDQAIAPLLAALQQAGFARANIAVLLAATLAKQVRPLVLIAIAFLTAFTFGRGRSL